MKKILIVFTIFISFIGINSVKAADLQCDLTSSLNQFQSYKSTFGIENFNYVIDDLLTEYKNNYSAYYPYYSISIVPFMSNDSDPTPDTFFRFQLYMFSNLPSLSKRQSQSGSEFGYNLSFENADLILSRTYQILIDGILNENLLTFENDENIVKYGLFSASIDSNTLSDSTCSLFPHRYYVSNFDLYLPAMNTLFSSSEPLLKFDNFQIPLLSNPTTYNIVSLSSDSYIFEPYYLYDNIVLSLPSISEVNLNDYAFVVLSLKDYDQEAFTSTIQVKGEYCVNAVYDYGLSAKEKYDSSITDICSPYYETFTPVRHYVIENDIKNHAIYYIKAHDTTKENIIKVDTSIFNIHYITEEEADNPVININGRNYSILPFDDLPSNSIKNTEEGNWPGESENINFSDIFTAPLDFLKDIWSSIVSVFDLIKEFISLLPEPIPTFLYSSFILGLSLGLLKFFF